MALVAKSNRILALKNSQQGQISIFFSASLIVFVSIIAFVINVGLFVKAKINLQNATDASAFAGAAVQARQLTKIAYLNWEMRNIYKEWMYKYYVIGSLNTPMVENPATPIDCGGKNCMNFRLASDNDVLSVPPRVTADPYNFPAVCIHIAGGKTNICKRYAVPGLPEFGGYNIPGTEEASRSFIDILAGEKVNDCVSRSSLNMMVATTWAYNVLPTTPDNELNSMAGKGPAILTDRQGAWPRAMELAMRIRNLEKIMNRESINKPVCIGDGGSCTPIDTFSNENLLGNERIVKAFYSGYRNLGNEADREMKSSFTLQELPPTKPALPGPNSNSSLLIPSSSRYVKQYVDLQLMMVNYATFFAALIPRSEKDKTGACDISKTALPVPGYPLGFYKNPEILTYYAVKGEADFEGMFNPFSAETIKLTAYAAAKPAGGRIGPMLFKQKPTESAIRPRTDDNKYRSVPYIATLKVDQVPNPFMPDGNINDGEYGPGAPLPINLGPRPFWLVDADSAVGGAPQGEAVQFGMPNLVYDFIDGNMDANVYTDNGSRLFIMQPGASTPPNDYSGDRPVGLFNHDQFVAFRGSIPAEVSPDMLADQILRVKAATAYEAANYMIPTPFDFNETNGVDSFGIISGEGMQVDNVPGLKRYLADIYAPLYRTAGAPLDIIYGDSTEVLRTIVDFMKQQKPGMDNYIHALNIAAVQAYKTSLDASEAAIGTRPLFEKAAKGISDIDVTNLDPAYAATAIPASCTSLSGTFWHFFYGTNELFNNIANQAGCPVPLATLLQEYFAKSAADPDYSPLHYKMEYGHYPANWGGKPLKIFSAYMPGPYNGISADGILQPPSGFPPNPEVMRRNFYSTKLVTLDSLQKGGNYDEFTQFAIHSEGELSTNQGTVDKKQHNFLNPLDAQSVGADISSIRY